MAIALKGFLTGIASGLSERIDEEREQTKKAIATRTSNAYKNYLAYQEQRNAVIEEAKKRDAAMLQYQDPNRPLTEPERITLMRMPNALEVYLDAVKINPNIKPHDIVTVSEEVKGMKKDDYLKVFGAIQPEQRRQIQEPTSLFAPSAARQQKMAEEYAGAVGMTPETLEAFAQPREAPTMLPSGTFNMEVLRKKEKAPESQEEMLKEALAARTQALVKSGKDSEAYKQADLLAQQIAGDMEQPTKTLEAEADRLNLSIINKKEKGESTTAEETRLKEVQRASLAHKMATSAKTPEDNKRTASSIGSSVRTYVGTRMREQVNSSWYKYTRDKTVDLLDGTTYTFREKKEDMPVEEQRAMFAMERQFALQALKDNGFVNERGVPAYDAVREVMTNLGLRGSMPTTEPASAAQPAPVRTQPSAPPMAGSAAVNIEQERANAKKAIADGANAAAVRARFKERTKQDL
jgi:hypothetical protein